MGGWIPVMLRNLGLEAGPVDEPSVVVGGLWARGQESRWGYITGQEAKGGWTSGQESRWGFMAGSSTTGGE